jgi:hypothetical protein
VQTAAVYTGLLSEEQVQALLRDISSAVPLGEDSLCAIFGYGSKTKSTYAEIDALPGAEVLWLGCFGPWWLSPLLWITPSKGGLVKVEARDRVAAILNELGDLAMVELISCSAATSDELLGYVRRNRWRSQPGEVASRDSNYFCCGFDGDYAYDAEGRFYTWCAIGKSGPDELTNAIAKYIDGR